MATEGKPVRVGVIEDNEIFRLGLVRTIEACDGLELLLAEPQRTAPAERLRELKPDVVVIGVSSAVPKSNRSAAPLTETLRGSGFSFILLTETIDVGVVYVAVAGGIKGYLERSVSAKELCHAVMAAAHGELVLSSETATRLAAEMMRRIDAPSPLLSDRELAVIQLAAEGNVNPAIAQRLLISRGTVKAHLRSAYAKLGAGERGEAIAEAMRRGLIT